MSMNLARVVAIHPEDNSVDLVMVDDGARLAGVQVLAGAASSNSGRAELHEPGRTVGDRWTLTEETSRDLIAVVGYVNRNPLVVGFLFPQVCQLLFARKNFRVNRHPSDVYTTVDDAGNVEVYHPSGTYLRIGEAPEHEDLTGQDFDKRWKIERNTGKAVHVQLQVKNAGALKATLHIDPSGNVALDHTGDLGVSTAGSIEVSAGGSIALTSGGLLTHNGKNVGATHTHGGVVPGGGSTAVPN